MLDSGVLAWWPEGAGSDLFQKSLSLAADPTPTVCFSDPVNQQSRGARGRAPRGGRSEADFAQRCVLEQGLATWVWATFGLDSSSCGACLVRGREQGGIPSLYPPPVPVPPAPSQWCQLKCLQRVSRVLWGQNRPELRAAALLTTLVPLVGK